MKMRIDCNYLNCERVQGKKDPTKTYCMALFMQGTDTLQLSCTEDAFSLLDGVNPMDEVRIEVDYSTQYHSLRMTDILSLD